MVSLFLQALARARILKDRTAVVSGGSSGIGLATARALATAGAAVTSADLQPPAGEDSVAISFQRTDVTQRADVAALVETTTDDAPVDLLVLSAGRGITERLAEGDPETWSSIVETNLMGALRLVRAFVPAMLAAGRGDVVFISSVAAEKTYSWGGVYAASKAALETVAETLRLEVQPTVRVTTIAPGVVESAFFENRIGGGDRPEDLGWGALAPEDVAEAILYAVTRPHEVAINSLTIRPVAQPL